MASDHRQQECFFPQEKGVDPSIWRACAGTLIHVPPVNSRVYYFPQGHIEQSSTTVSLLPLEVPPAIPCRILNVFFLADKDTDEVFVKFHLQPSQTTGTGFQGGCGGGGGGGSDIVSFAKVLTPSDANNGGGFSVPRFCADSIFPTLDFDADPPVQQIEIRDIHGFKWSFRHIYRGTPRRHLLTTGWSKFVNSKKLIAGDSVVFMKNKVTKELFVGLRRAYKTPVSLSTDSWGFLTKNTVPTVVSSGGGFSRSKRGRVPAEKVVEAVERAVTERMFEVVYYPRPGLMEFVVEAEKVDACCRVYWSPGMRVKLAQETEDGGRLTWYNGSIVSVASLPRLDNGRWRGSIWRTIEVDWDESEIMQNLKTVSPWQLQFISPTPTMHATLHPFKKFKGVEDSGQLPDGEGDPPLPSPMSFSSMMAQFNPSYVNFNTFPAGMQGARQNPFLLTNSLPNIANDNNYQALAFDNNVDNSSQKMKIISSNLNIGSSSSETPSPDSQNSVQLFGVASTEQRSCNLTKRGVTSFQLFGKVILMEQPSVVGEVGRKEFDDSTTEGTRNTAENSSSDASRSSDAL